MRRRAQCTHEEHKQEGDSTSFVIRNLKNSRSWSGERGFDAPAAARADPQCRPSIPLSVPPSLEYAKSIAPNTLLGHARMQKELLLGVDAGLTMTKTALFDEDGREVATVSTRSEISRPLPGYAERSMDETWTSAAQAIRKALAAAGISSENVAAVGLTGAMAGAWAIDAEGRPVRPAILVADTRGQEAIDAAVARAILRR